MASYFSSIEDYNDQQQHPIDIEKRIGIRRHIKSNPNPQPSPKPAPRNHQISPTKDAVIDMDGISAIVRSSCITKMDLEGKGGGADDYTREEEEEVVKGLRLINDAVATKDKTKVRIALLVFLFNDSVVFAPSAPPSK